VNGRDREYIDNRLTDPAGPALEAHGRLKQTGHHDLAAKLMRGIQDLTEASRAIRVELNRRDRP
jgi:hypothetical protein